jgi:hypothetical protein
MRTVNGSNQTNYTYDAFVLISSGTNNNKLDSPNTITNPNGVFASQQYPLSQNYDQYVYIPVLHYFRIKIESIISEFTPEKWAEDLGPIVQDYL